MSFKLIINKGSVFGLKMEKEKENNVTKVRLEKTSVSCISWADCATSGV